MSDYNTRVKLIKEVEKHPVLYTRQDYYIREKTVAAWFAVSRATELTVEKAKSIWRYLKNQHTKRKKEFEAGAEGPFNKPWKYAEMLQFLDQQPERGIAEDEPGPSKRQREDDDQEEEEELEHRVEPEEDQPRPEGRVCPLALDCAVKVCNLIKQVKKDKQEECLQLVKEYIWKVVCEYRGRVDPEDALGAEKFL